MVALDGVTVGVLSGTFTAVMVQSGSGKSTLLQCAAGLDLPTEGRAYIDGTEITGRDEATLTKFRTQRIGSVSPAVQPAAALTVLQNVTLPRHLAGRKVDTWSAMAMLERGSLADRLTTDRPSCRAGSSASRAPGRW